MNLLTTPIKDDSLIHWANAFIKNNLFDPEISIDTSKFNNYRNYDDLNALEIANTQKLTNKDEIKGIGLVETDFQKVMD